MRERCRRHRLESKCRCPSLASSTHNMKRCLPYKPGQYSYRGPQEGPILLALWDPIGDPCMNNIDQACSIPPFQGPISSGLLWACTWMVAELSKLAQTRTINKRNTCKLPQTKHTVYSHGPEYAPHLQVLNTHIFLKFTNPMKKTTTSFGLCECWLDHAKHSMHSIPKHATCNLLIIC